MPVYVYETIPRKPGDAVRRFEVRQSMSEAALQADPETGLPVKRVITGGIEMPRGPSDVRKAPVAKHSDSCSCCHPRRRA